MIQEEMYMLDEKTEIDGYECEMWEDETVCCYVYKTVRGVKYDASLTYLMDNGSLHDDHFNDHDVDADTIQEIEEWAVENGY